MTCSGALSIEAALNVGPESSLNKIILDHARHFYRLTGKQCW